MRTPPSPCTGSTPPPRSRGRCDRARRDRRTGSSSTPRQQRLERTPVERVAAERQRAERVAVKGALEGDELAPGPCACARSLARPRSPRRRCSRSRPSTVGAGNSAASRAASRTCGSSHVLAVDHRVQVAACLLPHRRDHLRMPVADVGDAHAGKKIEVRAALTVGHGRASPRSRSRARAVPPRSAPRGGERARRARSFALEEPAGLRRAQPEDREQRKHDIPDVAADEE